MKVPLPKSKADEHLQNSVSKVKRILFLSSSTFPSDPDDCLTDSCGCCGNAFVAPLSSTTHGQTSIQRDINRFWLKLRWRECTIHLINIHFERHIISDLLAMSSRGARKGPPKAEHVPRGGKRAKGKLPAVEQGEKEDEASASPAKGKVSCASLVLMCIKCDEETDMDNPREAQQK